MRCIFVKLAKLMCQNFKKPTKSQKFQFYSILVANPCDTQDSFKSNVNMFRFKYFSNFNY